jgi:hypothetical protein
MAIARFKDLCMDASDTAVLGPFWSDVLRLHWEPHPDGDGRATGATPQHTFWFNRVPEPKTVKHRVHLDIYVESIAALTERGATVVLPPGDDRSWTVLADPEGGEFCAFLRDEPPADRLHGLVVDSADPAAQARWWGEVYGADVVHDKRGWSTVEHVPGMPILTMDFNPVPEPKTVKNRIHWDVSVADLQPLLDMGATLLRSKGGDISWHVLADPEGNEFCAFVD